MVDQIAVSALFNLKLTSYSRYRGSYLYPGLQNAIGPLRLTTVPESGEDLFHTVEIHDQYRLDKISYQYYNNAYWWWIIAMANQIYNPLIAPIVGDVLRIPDLSTINTYFAHAGGV